MLDALAVVARRWDSWRTQVRGYPVGPRLTDAAIRERLAAYDFGRPCELTALTEAVAELIEHGSLHPTHPRYFGLFVPGVRPAGIVADALAAAYNPQLGAWWHAPAANHLERITLDFFRERIGLPSTAFACFTTGGSEANLTAVLAALAAAFPRFVEDGLTGAHAVMYASDQAHDSFVKIARSVGLGERAVHRVRSDARQRIDVDALQDAIAADRANGRTPFLVVATVGTTATGALDPVGTLAELSRREGLWLHADAAWGGGALLSDTLRSHLIGLERADSITWDAHKTLPVPLGAGMYFARERRFTDAVFSVHTTYVPETAPFGHDAYQQTVQWSRRFIGLKVFMTLAELGLAGVAALVDRQAAIADILRESLRAAGWTIANDTPLPLVCFTRAGLGPEETATLVRSVVAEGATWIAEVRLPDGARWLRACVTHHEASPADVHVLVEALRRALRRGSANGAASRSSVGCVDD